MEEIRDVHGVTESGPLTVMANGFPQEAIELPIAVLIQPSTVT